MDHFLSALLPEGEEDMAWEIGDRGFNLVLSSYVPGVIGSNVKQAMEELLAQGDAKIGDIDLWAVHPGGKAILDKVEESLDLKPEQIRVPREILRSFGNMSSATILFVLERLLAEASENDETQRVAAMAFGPGLTVESTLLRLLPPGVAERTEKKRATASLV
jgi:predicted naringenin-chalcone synthase